MKNPTNWLTAIALLVMAGVVVNAYWFRHLPQAEGRITGDFAAARELSTRTGALFVVAVEPSPG